MKKIAIMGGTFDPVHNGHISLAADAFEQVCLDRIIMMPAKLQPFKLDKKVSDSASRMEMLKLAFGEESCSADSHIEVSGFEIESQDISYTYKTLREMRKRFGEKAVIYFITGTDAFLKIQTWKNSREILEGFAHIVGTRPGYKEDELGDCIAQIRESYGTEIIKINNKRIDISSSVVRRKIGDGEDVSNDIPAAVERYIRQNGLYRELY